MDYQCELRIGMANSMQNDDLDTEQVRIVGLAGSLRKESLNKKLLRAAISLSPQGMVIKVQDISLIPLYNADLEDGLSLNAVYDFKEAISGSDGILFVTPEYNFGIPAVTKNLIDWASVKSVQGNVLYRKPIAIMGIGGGTRGNTSIARMEVRQSVVFPGALPLPGSDVGISGGLANFDNNGNLIDQDSITRVSEYLIEFKRWILFTKER